MKKRWKFYVPIWTLPKEVYCSTYPGFSFGNWSVCLPSFLIPFNFFQSQGDMNLNYFALLHFMRCGKAIPIHRRFWQKMEHFSLRDLILPFSEEKSHQENSIGLPSLLLEPPFVNIIKCCNALSAIKSWGCWSGIALLHFYALGGIRNYNLQLRVLKAGPKDEAFLPLRPNHAFLAEISHHENSIGLPHCY